MEKQTDRLACENDRQIKRQACEQDGRQIDRQAYKQKWWTQTCEKDGKTAYFAYFSFIFASDFCCFTSMRNKRNYTFFASKQNNLFASISGSEVESGRRPAGA
jgi:hypothetical protein